MSQEVEFPSHILRLPQQLCKLRHTLFAWCSSCLLAGNVDGLLTDSSVLTARKQTTCKRLQLN